MSTWRDTALRLFDDPGAALEAQRAAEMELLHTRYVEARREIDNGNPEKVPAAERLLRENVLLFRDEIIKFIKWQGTRRGKIHGGMLSTLISLPPELVALVTLRCMFSRVMADQTYYAMADVIGQMLFLEYQYLELDKETKKRFHYRYPTPGVRALSEYISVQKRKGFVPPQKAWLSTKNKRMLGFLLVKLATNTLDIFEERRMYAQRKTWVFPVFSNDVVKSLLDIKNNPSWVWTPILAPMLCPPLDWTHVDEEKHATLPIDRRE